MERRGFWDHFTEGLAKHFASIVVILVLMGIFVYGFGAKLNLCGGASAFGLTLANCLPENQQQNPDYYSTQPPQSQNNNTTPYCVKYLESGVGQTTTLEVNIDQNWVAIVDANYIQGYSSTSAVVSITGPISSLTIRDGAVCAVPLEWREWAENSRLAIARSHNQSVQLIRR